MTHATRIVPFSLDGEQFIARGVGSALDIVTRSASRRIDGSGLTLWPGDEAGHYRAQWFDDVQEVFCEVPLIISIEVALANR